MSAKSALDASVQLAGADFDPKAELSGIGVSISS
jgi:hypothetical protein